MKTRTVVELPGYVTVSAAAERLRLAPRSVRDLVYAGRMPSARLGRRHFLRVPDVETERRRRLGLPLPQPRRVSRRAARGAEGRTVLAHGPRTTALRRADAVAQPRSVRSEA